MSTPRRRGRPTRAEIEARPAPEEVKEVILERKGIVPPCCGRGMEPYIVRASAEKLIKTLVCTSCGRHLKGFYSDEGKLLRVQRI